MSQTFTTIAGTDTNNASRAVINANFDALKTMFSGTSAPSPATTGMLWLDTDTPSGTVWTVKQYDGTDWIEIWRIDTTNNVPQLPSGTTSVGTLTMGGNIAMGTNKVTGNGSASASTDLPTKAQTDARIISTTVPLGSLSATFDRFLTVGRGTMTVANAYIIVGTTIAASATDYWTLQIRNVTAGNNLLATAINTTATPITADTLRAFNLDQNLTIADGDVLQLQVTKTLSPTAFDAESVIILTYKVAT